MKDPRIPPSAKIAIDKYIIIILFIWGYSWVPSIILGNYYYKFFIFPNLEIFTEFNSIFSDWRYILISVITPLVAIILYIFRLFFLVLSPLQYAKCAHNTQAQPFCRPKAANSTGHNLRVAHYMLKL